MINKGRIFLSRSILLLFFSVLMLGYTYDDFEGGVPLERLVALLSEYYDDLSNDSSVSALPEIDFENIEINYSDVAPVLYSNCTNCHKPEGNAPFSLMDYNNVKKRALVIREVIEKRIMPPWIADDEYSHFFNAPELTDSTRAMLIEWIDRGCPNNKEVDINEIGSKSHIQPDTILRQKKRHVINSNTDSYHCFVYDPEFKEDKYVTGIEFLSDNPSTVHHLTLFLDTTEVMTDVKEECWDCTKEDLIDMGRLINIVSWTNGMRPYNMNPRFAQKIPKGSRFLLQTHYNEEHNKGKLETTEIKLYFSNPTEEDVRFDVHNDFDIFYPANEILIESLIIDIEDSISLLGIIPHAHFITKKIECFAVTPEKEVIDLLKIPDWNYSFQGHFLFEKAILIPKDSRVYCYVVADNTAENPTQPNDPVRDVRYGKGAYEEMLVLVLINKKYSEGDEKYKVGELLD